MAIYDDIMEMIMVFSEIYGEPPIDYAINCLIFLDLIGILNRDFPENQMVQSGIMASFSGYQNWIF